MPVAHDKYCKSMTLLVLGRERQVWHCGQMYSRHFFSMDDLITKDHRNALTININLRLSKRKYTRPKVCFYVSIGMPDLLSLDFGGNQRVMLPRQVASGVHSK